MADPEKLPESEVEETSEFSEAFAEFSGADAGDPPDPELKEVLPAVAAGDDEIVPDPDPYDGLSEVQITHFKKLEETNTDLQHRHDSNVGRVSALQLKINRIESGETASPTPTDKPSETAIKEAMGGTNKEWDEFKEEYPHIAAVMDHRMQKGAEKLQTAVNETLAPVQETIARHNADAANAEDQVRVDKVAEEYPEWTAVTMKPEFTEWLLQQTPGVIGLSNSPDARDASELLGKYDEHLVANGQPSIKKAPTEPGGNEDDNAAGANSPTSLGKRREQQLADGTTIPSKSAGIDGTGESMSEFSSAFKVYAKRLDEKNVAAGVTRAASI